MYNNPYFYQNNFNQQSLSERIDNQITQLQQMKEQMKNNSQQPAINQTFQLAPTNHGGIKYVNTINDVNKETVYMDTPFFSKDMSVVWIKNSKGEIKTYEMKEIVQLDEKDVQIEFLQKQIEDLRNEMRKNEQYTSNVDEAEISEYTETINEPTRKSTKNDKSTGLSRISKSKAE